jgi:hypothetical protein
MPAERQIGDREATGRGLSELLAPQQRVAPNQSLQLRRPAYSLQRVVNCGSCARVMRSWELFVGRDHFDVAQCRSTTPLS